jgi:hypothetical protein
MEIKNIITHVLKTYLNEKFHKLEKLNEEESKELNQISLKIKGLKSRN